MAEKYGKCDLTMSDTFIINGEILKEFFGSISVMGVHNVILHMDPVKGFYGKITDIANTTLLDIQYLPAAFVSYKCDNPRDVGIDVKAFIAITSKIKKGTKKNTAPLVSLDIREKEILISINGETTNIRILDEKECQRETRTTFNFPVIMTVDHNELINSLKNAKKINDKSVTLAISAGTLLTRSDGCFGDTLVKQFNSCTNVKGWFKTHFTPRLIIDCLKGMYKDIPITVSTKTDYPIVLYQETEYSHIQYAIAPRMRTDEDHRIKKDPVWVRHLYSAGLISPDMFIVNDTNDIIQAPENKPKTPENKIDAFCTIPPAGTYYPHIRVYIQEVPA